MCRLIQLGGTLKVQRPFSASKPAFCYVGVNEDGKLWIDQQTGSQRISGQLLHDENQRRMVFLGARKIGRARSLPTYQEAGAQQTAGIFERVGPLRYRLVIPRPQSKYRLELLELTPAAIQLDS
jgi:hypothetical protein